MSDSEEYEDDFEEIETPVVPSNVINATCYDGSRGYDQTGHTFVQSPKQFSQLQKQPNAERVSGAAWGEQAGTLPALKNGVNAVGRAASSYHPGLSHTSTKRSENASLSGIEQKVQDVYIQKQPMLNPATGRTRNYPRTHVSSADAPAGGIRRGPGGLQDRPKGGGALSLQQLKASVREIPLSALEMGAQVSGGGFCVLHRAEWIGIPVAVKQLFDPKVTPELKAEFHNEAHCLSTLRHPHIVPLLGMCSVPPTLCLVMEFMARGSLYHVLHESQLALNAKRQARMSWEIATALHFVHTNNLVHRDIKSANVLADEFLRMKLCDFGLTVSAASDAVPASTGVGTPQYMAPELWRAANASVSGDSNTTTAGTVGGTGASFASDVYAFGVLLWELWARDCPFDGIEVAEIRRRCVNGSLQLPPLSHTVPRLVASLVARCCDSDAHKRPTMAEVSSALSQLMRQA